MPVAAEQLAANVQFGHELGWSFTPLAGKRPTLKGWQERPRESLEEALAWAAQGNVGLRTGRASGVVVVDVDPGARIDELELPGTVAAATGRPGGLHLYFRCTEPVGNSNGKKLGPHIDFKGDGGQVVFPGSVHPETGAVYAWLEGHEPWNVEIAELPAHILERLRAPDRPKPAPMPQPAPVDNVPTKAKHYAQTALKLELHAICTAAEGSRNETLNKAAFSLGTLIGGGYLDRAEVEAALRSAAESVGLEADETEATIRSGIQGGLHHPRRIELKDSPGNQPNNAPAGGTADLPLGRPTILIDTDEYRVVSETITALTADTDMYQRGGILVRVIRDTQPKDDIVRPSGSPTIQALPPANLRERMTRFAAFTKVNRKGEEVPAHPAPWLVSAVDARADWPGIRHLAGVSDAPVLRADGSIWQTPGYDSQTGVLFETSESFPPISNGVTIDDAVAALDEVLEVVCDFLFESDEHGAAWLSGLLTPLARFAFDGPTPLFLLDANVRGAGKGLLAQTIGKIVLGREMPVSSYAHESEEMRKRITAIAIAGDRMILLDNLGFQFGNDALDRALTSTRWKDRILGKSEEVDLPLLPAWYATGNNVAVAADTARRVMHIRLDVLDENPEERTGFRHPNLLAWVGENRGRLLSGALTILSAFCRAGRPSQGLTPYGSFEGWSALVREAVVWVGLPDPCLTRVRLAESADTTVDSLSQLINAWRLFDPSGIGVVVSEALARLYPPDRQYAPIDLAATAMRSALENLVGCPSGKPPTPRQVGNRLRRFRRRVLKGCYLDIDASRGRRDGHVWKLYGAPERESGEFSESFSTPTREKRGGEIKCV